jgi:hypothetical protein
MITFDRLPRPQRATSPPASYVAPSERATATGSSGVQLDRDPLLDRRFRRAAL